MALARNVRHMHPVWRTLAECSGGHVLARDGVSACVVPAVPDRSLPNSVLYEEPEAAAEQLDDLAAAYDAAGVRAWTVWVHPGDDALARTLAARGHVLDASPTAMNLDDLGTLPAARELPPGVTIEHPGDAAVLGRLNDEAYGLPVGTFGDLVAQMGGALHVHLASLDGRPAAGTATFDVEDDTALAFVATGPWAQRRGLASSVVHRALLAARDRGRRTSTLQATRAGAPVYARLGYRAVGALHMWEHRRP